MKGFKFENQLMEEHFNESYVESSKFPKSDFKGMITNIKDINFSKDGTYPAKVKGSLTIHGVTRETEANGTLEVKGASVTAKTKFVVKLGDYGISSKKIGKNIAETIAITVDCRYE
jgi:polyisoprenoid-binding protein YceI